ncbi:MAG: hypothetical protein U0T73_01310 [Chitinophagales bacterium]
MRYPILLIFILGLLLLNSCTKNSHEFDFGFYTANKNLPPLYLVYNGKNLGRVPYRATEPSAGDTSIILVQANDTKFHIDAADAKGNVVATMTYTLNDDGSFKGTGGGYLLYDTYSREKYQVRIAFQGQF